MTAMKLTIYEKPTCTTCRQVTKVIEDAGFDFNDVNYFIQPLTAAKYKELLGKMGKRPREVIRTKEDSYKTLRLGERDLSDDELITIMVEHPELIQRPIIEYGDQA